MYFHLSQSVKGALRNWKAKDWKNNAKFFSIDGKRVSADALKDAFLTMLQEGIEAISVGDCDNFDPKKGCLGHAESEWEMI
jgi:hypothetical protein